ncbi:MAG: hypothetical protein H7336_11265 [Bacteriovorax sp.]|nr:hypothetical protein [Bacteriovorax sp.]
MAIIFFSLLLRAEEQVASTNDMHQSYMMKGVKIDSDFFITKDRVHEKFYQYPLSYIGNHSQPFSQEHQITRADGKIIYEHYYTIGEFGFRQIDPKYYSKNSKFHLITAGDSNTFGEGISEADLLAVQLANKMKDSHPYNFGIRGSGPHNTLALMEFFPWEKLIKEPKGVFIYNYYEFLIERVIGYRHIIEWSHGNDPYYALNDKGEAVYKGLFSSRPLTYFFDVLNYYPFISNLFPVLPRPSHRHLELLAKMFFKMQEKYKKKFPQGHFLVAVNYFYGNNNAGKLEELEQELTKNKIPYIVVPPHEYEPRFLYEDGHLNSMGHKIEAELFLKILPLN